MDKSSTIHLIVGNESFELSTYLYNQFIEYSSSNNQNKISFDVDPKIFNAYLLYIQTGCFIRPDYLSNEDLINGLKLCGAPFHLINHYEQSDITSFLCLHPYSCYRINEKNRFEQKWLNTFVLIGLFLATYILTIDLYRQMLILNENSYQEISKFLIISIYLIDSLLFIYSCLHGIRRFILDIKKENRLEKDPYFIIDIISCLGILCYFISQRPITNIYISYWNSFWIFVHMCRTIRIVQIGFRLIDIQWCLYAITQCIWTFLQILTGLFWIFIYSGSILYIIDIIENNQQYSSIYLTILSTHETLYTIGYRNNPPYGYLTRLWTILSIHFLSSFVQIFFWWFQTKVRIQWKNL